MDEQASAENRALDQRAAVAFLLYQQGGQCGRCGNAVWRGREVVGCGIGGKLEGPTGELAGILAALLYQQARYTHPLVRCVARIKLDIYPDAYFAQDAAPP